MKKLSLLFGVLLLSGCSWFSDEEDAAITPAELVDFNSEVSVKRSWSKKVGSGTKNYLVSLRPTASSDCLLYTSPSPRDRQKSRMPSSA